MYQTIKKTLPALLILILIGCRTKLIPGSTDYIKSIISKIDDAVLVAAKENNYDWLSYGKNYSEDRYSSLNQINLSNVKDLGLAWSIDLGTMRGIEATPIVVDGIMYFTGPWSVVYAVDTRKQEIIWMYDPEVPKTYGEKACCDVVNRGVAVYKGMVIFGALDGRLIAIDAANGEKVWETLTVDQNKGYTITGAPRVVNGKVIIGNGGAEFGVRGYISAFDAITGKQVWRVYTVPGNPSDGFESDAMAKAAKTWTGEWWKLGGGGTAWDAMAFDPDLNLLYVGTGNGSPWNREIRSPGGGDNLYLSSILALNPDTGKVVWYYQCTPGDSWDYTSTQHIILADLEIKGKTRKVLMQAPKNGFFYVLDRITGEFISAEPYVYVNWAKGIDKETGRPIENEFSRYNKSNTMIAPHPFGGHNWHPMAYNTSTGLVYIPAHESSMVYGQSRDFKVKNDGKTWNIGIGFDRDLPFIKDSLAKQFAGKIIAWDPVTQKEKWIYKHLTPWNGGILSTKDLIFQGTGTGYFCAYDANTGEKVFEFPLQTGIVAAPITYMVDGVQYVTIIAGWGGVLSLTTKFTKQINPGAVYTFAIGGNKPKPVFEQQVTKKLIDLEYKATPQQLQKGGELFARYCGRCHGGGIIPDLSYASPDKFELFSDIVKDGLFVPLGMPKFGDRLNDQDVSDIKNYILHTAKQKSSNSTGRN
jgi:quinohemoprotein ethanol dehydrogenase